jgi:hypothetical protein
MLHAGSPGFELRAESLMLGRFRLRRGNPIGCVVQTSSPIRNGL